MEILLVDHVFLTIISEKFYISPPPYIGEGLNGLTVVDTRPVEN